MNDELIKQLDARNHPLPHPTVVENHVVFSTFGWPLEEDAPRGRTWLKVVAAFAGGYLFGRGLVLLQGWL